MGFEWMEMGGNGNVESHSRTSLYYSQCQSAATSKVVKRYCTPISGAISSTMLFSNAVGVSLEIPIVTLNQRRRPRSRGVGVLTTLKIYRRVQSMF